MKFSLISTLILAVVSVACSGQTQAATVFTASGVIGQTFSTDPAYPALGAVGDVWNLSVTFQSEMLSGPGTVDPGSLVGALMGSSLTVGSQSWTLDTYTLALRPFEGSAVLSLLVIPHSTGINPSHVWDVYFSWRTSQVLQSGLSSVAEVATTWNNQIPHTTFMELTGGDFDFSKNWRLQGSSNPGASFTVPEPGSIGGILLAVSFFVSPRRRSHAIEIS
jgi:hypothetical protein